MNTKNSSRRRKNRARAGIIFYSLFVLFTPFKAYKILTHPFDVSTDEVFLVLGFITVLLGSFDKSKIKMAFIDIFLLFLMFIASLVSSLANSFITMYSITSMVKILLVYFAGVFAIGSISDVVFLLRSIVSAAVLSSLVAVMQAFFGFFLELGRPTTSSLFLIRTAGPYTIYGEFGFLLLLALPCTMMSYCSRHGTIIRNKVFSLAILALTATGIALSQTRGVWLSAITVSVLTGFTCVKTKMNIRSRKYYLFVLILMGILVAFYWKHFLGLWDYLSAMRVHDTLEMRIALLRFSVELFKRNPLIGIGIARYHEVADQFGEYAVIHNLFAEVLVSLGLLGGVLFFAFIILSVYRAIVLFLSNDSQFGLLPSIVPLGILGVFIESQAVRSFYSQELWLAFTILSGMFFVFKERSVIGSGKVKHVLR